MIKAAVCGVVVLVIAGCASTNSGGLTTQTRLHDAAFAARAGATQETVNRCEAVGRAAAATGDDSFRDVRNGNAFEACILASQNK